MLYLGGEVFFNDGYSFIFIMVCVIVVYVMWERSMSGVDMYGDP